MESFLKFENRFLCETIIGSVPGNYIELFNTGTNTPRTAWMYNNCVEGYGLDRKYMRMYTIGEPKQDQRP